MLHTSEQILPDRQDRGTPMKIPACANLSAVQVLWHAEVSAGQSCDIHRSTYSHSSTGKPVVFFEAG